MTTQDLTQPLRLTLEALDADRAALAHDYAVAQAKTAGTEFDEASFVAPAPRYADAWIEIKPRRSYGDILKADAVIAVTDGPEGRVFDFSDRPVAMLAIAITRWNLPGRAAFPIDRTARMQAIGDLEPEEGELITTLVTEHYDSLKRGDADTKASGGSSPSGPVPEGTSPQS